jgi:hypothetical protein
MLRICSLPYQSREPFEKIMQQIMLQMMRRSNHQLIVHIRKAMQQIMLHAINTRCLTITLSPRRQVQQMHATTQGKNTITVMKRFGLNRNFSIITDLVNYDHQCFPFSVHLNTCIYCDRYHIVIHSLKNS